MDDKTPDEFDEINAHFDLEDEVAPDEAQTHALVKRPVVQLADAKGEWFYPEKPPQDDDESDAEESEKPEPASDLYTAFVQQATRLPRLSEEEERRLGLLVREQHDTAAAKKLVLHNMRLAIKMAHQHRRSWASIMDLVQEASAGMAIAAEKWDPDKGTRFGTYAAYWIRAQLTKFIMTNGRLIHTGNTRAGRKVYFSLPHIRRQLLLQGKEPTVEIIAKEIGEDPIEVAQILTRLQGHETSLSTPLDEDGANTLQEIIASSSETPEHQVSASEIKKLLDDIIAKFEKTISNERDLAIWRKHLIAAEPQSLVDLGKQFGVSKQRMGQLATRLKRSFRRHVIDELGPDTQLSWLFNAD